MKISILVLLLLSCTQAWGALTFSSTLKASSISLSNSDTTATGGGIVHDVYLDMQLDMTAGGKYYYEFVLESGGGGQTYTGFTVRDVDPISFTAGFPVDYNFSASRSLYQRNDLDDYYTNFVGVLADQALTFSAGDVVMIAIDLDDDKYYMGKNGTWSATDPSLGNGVDMSSIIYSSMYMAVSLAPGDVARLNQSATFTEPVGFSYLGGTPSDIDTDGDGVLDSGDNCLLVANNDQRDTNSDGFGNLCDADLNDDCIVNLEDLGLFKSVIFTSSPDADFNGDGVVNFVDLGFMKLGFFAPPGPNFSGVCP